jgi:ABC-type polysaccharide/polyol phosphate transport system ATPase subunit
LPTSSEPHLAIDAHELHKDYRLGEFADIRRLLPGGRGKRTEGDGSLLAALDDVSFQVGVGECLGVMGRNGSGKSTLVQILAGITVPTGGRVSVRGRVLPLLEVGAVFNDELTGRENVTHFGTILGLTRRVINGAMEEISEFSGIDMWHMDTPLKRHSTGMRARLSFAVAMRFPADIYIFDEVIAVVDDHFRMLAQQEIRSLLEVGRTVIFISHDLDLVRSLCEKGLWLDKGRQRAFGPVDEVADLYAESEEPPA